MHEGSVQHPVDLYPRSSLPTFFRHMTHANEASPTLHTRIAGVGYLIIIFSGLFAEFFVRGSLLVHWDPAATMSNLATAEQLYRFSIAADLVMITFDVVVAIMLYLLFQPVNGPVALLATAFRLTHAAVYGATILTLYIPLIVLNADGGVTSYAAAPLYALEAHSYGYVIGLVFFGVHCLLLGYLAIRSRGVPRILGGLLMLAGAGYLADSFAQTLMVNYADVAEIFSMVVFIPAVIGELSFCIWLLTRRTWSVQPRG